MCPLMSGCLIICSITLTDWLMEWFDVTMSSSWSDVSVLPLYLLLFSFPTSQSERFMLNRAPGNFWQTQMMWQREVLEHSVSLQAVSEHHMPKTLLYNKSTQSTQTFGSLISPYLPVTTMWTVWLYPCHPSNNNYFMPWTLTSLSLAIIWQVRKRES